MFACCVQIVKLTAGVRITTSSALSLPIFLMGSAFALTVTL